MSMHRPVTLFTGQWADLPIEDLAAKAGSWGFDGLELACWGDHFEVDRALEDDGNSEGVRTRAAERMKDTARAAARLGVRQVNGFTGSPVWHLIYSFPPNDFDEIERAYED